MRDTARDRIVGIADGSLSETIYAGAGAGTGKTQALVERIANLVIRGGVKPENIVAITFTVAAASELRQRVREELEERLAQARSARGESAGHESALGSALESLDSAFIGTIHSFAQSLLREWPLGVGLPPVFELLDSVQGDTRFDDEWDEWLEGAFSQPEFSRAVIGAQQLGLRSPLATLRDLAAELHASYDLVERVGELPQHTSSVDPRTLLSSIRSDLAKAIDLRDHCANPDDLLLSHLDTTIVLALSWIDEALDSDSDEECVLALTQLEKLSSGSGRKGDWSALAGGDSSLDEVRALLNAAQQTLESGRQSLGEATVVPLVNAVAKMVLGYADKRRTEGLLEFQDLLVLSCRLLTANREAREYFQARYTYILIDEFQDTDPLQLKLAMLLANRPERPDRASQTANENKNGVPTPGALFVVGDDKQSIYRFRRADLSQLQSLIDSLGARRLSLSLNYRSDPEILNWVNAVFDPWMNGPAVSERDPNQAQYVPLEAGRSGRSNGTGSDTQIDAKTQIPRVQIMGGIADGNVDVAREAEAADLAQLALDVGSGRWTLVDRDGEAYQSSFRDLCVLMPRRTALPGLETAFIEHNVPYVLEGQAPVFESQTFHELSNNLAAIDDPTDQVAIVAALKSNAWGCSDQDLLEWAAAGHRFEYARVRHDSAEFAGAVSSASPGVRKVADALSGIAEFHDQRQEQSTPYLIERFVRARRLRVVAALMDPTGDRERLIDLFIEMSRSLQRSGTGSLREFVRWLSRQAEASVRVSEGALANNELNAVRVMTIHAAKGLEFPIVVLAGLQVGAAAPRGSSIVKEEHGRPVMAVKLGSQKLGLSTPNYEAVAEADKDADEAELVRLAYVGATRAREHLIVSVHRTGRQKNTLAGRISEFAGLIDDLWKPFGVIGQVKEDPAGATESKDSPPDIVSLDDREEWIREMSDVVAAAAKRGYVTPSELADHEMFVAPKPEDNTESTEWHAARRGRGGTDIGSAVHAVLQDVDFGDLSTLDDLVRLSANAYSIPDQRENIERLVRNVLESPVVAGATSDNSWREVPVAAEISEGVEIEGFIDLIVRNSDDTVTIVDYKTDLVSGELLVERAKGYEPQLAGYVLAVEKLGMKVERAVLVFADGGPDGKAFEHPVADLDAAKITAIKKISELVG